MKRAKTVLTVLSVMLIAALVGCAGSAAPAASDSSVMTLDMAIKEAAEQIDGRFEANSKIALVNFNSSSDQFSAYVLDELTANLVDSRHLEVIDRQEIELRRGELNLQMSGEVSDDSMQALGRTLGAQNIVSGSLTSIGDVYRIVIRALNVESGRVEVQYRNNIVNDAVVTALLGSGSSGQASAGSTSTGSTSAGSQSTASGGGETATASGNTAPAAAARATGAKNGTYTIFPRLQATQAGRPVDAYLEKITVSGGYVTFFITSVPRGVGGYYSTAGNWYHGRRLVLLQDLDNPARTYNVINSDSEAGNINVFVTFENVRGTRFRLNEGSQPSIAFEEIIIPDEPDE